VAVALFGVLFVASTQVPTGRSASPWAQDPYDGALSFAALLLPFAVVPTVVRLLAHRGARPMTAHAARAVLAGCLLTLACVAGALLTALAAVAVGAGEPGRAPGWLLGLLAVTTIAAGAAAGSVAAAMRPWRGTWHGSDPARPDLVDDLATAVSRLWPGSLPARRLAWLVTGLDTWRASPRRHPAGFVAVASLVGGLGLTAGHAATEGPWRGPVAPALFAALVAMVVATGLAAGITWLGLLRPVAQPPPA
jgi:hypothetical protein